MIIEEDIQTLTRLGLTILQAEIYLTLTKLEKATIKTLSTTTKIDRANVYRIVSKLQELRLVEKMITNPTVYKAVPIQDGAPMLLERQTQEYQEIRLRTKELLRRNTRSDKEKLPQQEYQFALIPHNRATWRKLDEMKERSQKNCDFLFYWKAFSMFGIESVMHFLKKPVDKGLNVRLITYMNEGEKLHKKVLTLQDKGNFKVRCTFDSPPITLSLFDNKEVLMNTTTFSPFGTPSLWSNNPVLIGIFQDYFDEKWSNATDQVEVMRNPEKEKAVSRI